MSLNWSPRSFGQIRAMVLLRKRSYFSRISLNLSSSSSGGDFCFICRTIVLVLGPHLFGRSLLLESIQLNQGGGRGFSQNRHEVTKFTKFTRSTRCELPKNIFPSGERDSGFRGSLHFGGQTLSKSLRRRDEGDVGMDQPTTRRRFVRGCLLFFGGILRGSTTQLANRGVQVAVEASTGPDMAEQKERKQRGNKAALEGIELEYEVCGAERPVGLLHAGLFADCFSPLLNERALTVHYRVLSYHRVGYAGSTRLAGSVTIAQQAKHTWLLMRHL